MTDRSYTNPKTGEIVDATPRPATEILAELSEGATLVEFSEAIYDVIQRVQETTKAGSVTLHIDIALDGRGVLVFKDQVKHKLPEFSRPETRFFVAKDGNPSRRDPNQPEIPGVTSINDKRGAQ